MSDALAWKQQKAGQPATSGKTAIKHYMYLLLLKFINTAAGQMGPNPVVGDPAPGRFSAETLTKSGKSAIYERTLFTTCTETGNNPCLRPHRGLRPA